jgi:hypothetical protein
MIDAFAAVSLTLRASRRAVTALGSRPGASLARWPCWGTSGTRLGEGTSQPSHTGCTCAPPPRPCADPHVLKPCHSDQSRPRSHPKNTPAQFPTSRSTATFPFQASFAAIHDCGANPRGSAYLSMHCDPHLIPPCKITNRAPIVSSARDSNTLHQRPGTLLVFSKRQRAQRACPQVSHVV